MKKIIIIAALSVFSILVAGTAVGKIGPSNNNNDKKEVTHTTNTATAVTEKESNELTANTVTNKAEDISIANETIPTTENSYTDCNLKNGIFDTGEHLSYNVYYNWTAVWMNAGKVDFNIQDGNVNGKDAFHIVSEGRTARKFDWFYKVRDRYETYMDKETLRPLRFVRNIREGDFRLQHLYTFYPEKDEVYIHYHRSQGKTRLENKTVDIPACTHDLVSAVYYTRCIDYDSMVAGDIFEIDMFLDGEMWPVHARYMGKEILKTDIGKFRCVKFAPLLLQGEYFEGGEDMMVWATDDENRLPIYIESPLVVGKVKAYLEDFSGLQHPLTSKLD